MTTAPKWAQDLTLDTLIYLQSRGYKPEVPILNWRHGRKRQSSGRCIGKNYIVITAGKNRTDAKMVLLHEIAHLVTESETQYLDVDRAKKRGWIFPAEPDKPIVSKVLCHTDKFWDLAWELYRWAKLPIRYCKTREQQYRVGALAAYRRSKGK